jgi:hypothetical protein
VAVAIGIPEYRGIKAERVAFRKIGYVTYSGYPAKR